MSLTKNLERKKKAKTNIEKNKRRRPIFNPTIQPVVVNLYTKYEVSIFDGCGDILTKILERKKKKQTKGRTNRRIPVVDLYTKYEVSILNGCGDTFDEKVLRNYGRTDGTTDGCTPVYPPLFQSGGIIND